MITELPTKRTESLSQWQTFLGDFTYTMAAKINWHRYGTKLRTVTLCIKLILNFLSSSISQSVVVRLCTQSAPQAASPSARLDSSVDNIVSSSAFDFFAKCKWKLSHILQVKILHRSCVFAFFRQLIVKKMQYRVARSQCLVYSWTDWYFYISKVDRLVLR